MPTKHRRHIVTEVGPVAEAFSRARAVKPDVHLKDLVVAGADAIVARAEGEALDAEARAAAIERLIARTTRAGGVDREAALQVHDDGWTPDLRDG